MPESWILGAALVVAVIAAAAAIVVGSRFGTLRRLIADLTARVEGLEAGGVVPQLHPTAITRRKNKTGVVATVNIANDGTSAARDFVVTRALVSIITKDGHARATTLVAGDPDAVVSIEPGRSVGVALLALPVDALKTATGEGLVVTRVEGTYTHVVDASGTTVNQTYVHQDEAAETKYGLPDVPSWRPRESGGFFTNFWDAMS